MTAIQDKHPRFKQLLAIHKLQRQYQQSWLGKLARFQTLEWSSAFSSKNSIPGFFNLRIDDLVYLTLLLCANLAFSIYSHITLSTLPAYPFLKSLVDAFKQYNIMMWLGSALWLTFPHWYCKFAVFGIYVVMPALVFVAMPGTLPLDPVDPTATMLDYMGYLTLPLLMLVFVIVYPLKGYIRDKIGSVYSYLYAFGVILLLFLWPVYELLKEFIVSMGTIQLQFLSNNLPILYSLWAIILLSVYLFVHRTLISPSQQRIKGMLLRHLTQQDIDGSNVDIEDCGFLVRHYRAYSRTISVLVFLGLLGSQGYFLSLMITYVQSLNLYSIAIMGFMLIYSPMFLVLGCFVVNSPIRNGILFAILSIFSVTPSFCYPFIGDLINSNLALMILFVGPFTMLFWMVVRTGREENRTQVLGMVFYLYVFYYVPVVLLALNQLELLTGDRKVQMIVWAVCLGVMGVAAGVVVLYWIIKASIGIYNFIAQKQSQTESAEDKAIDFDFEQEPLNYIPYVVRKSFSLQGLNNVDLLRFGYLVNSILFVVSISASLYTLKQMLSHPPSYYYSPSLQNVITSQFPMLLLFYLFFQVYLTSQPFQKPPGWFIAYLVISLITSLTLLGVSFVFSNETLQVVFRLSAVVIFILLIMAIGLAILKNKNTQLHRFLTPVSMALLWFLVVMPFVEIVPVACAWIQQGKFGEFMYYVILGASTEVILAVLAITLIFNALMNRFQQQKRVKFVTNELKLYFNDSGVQADDNSLHKLYQSYQFRDKKYYFYLKHGFPVMLETKQQDRLMCYEEKDEKDKTVGSEVDKNQQEQPTKRSCLMGCLDCLCGDDEMFDEKVSSLVTDKKINKNDLEELMPLMVLDYAIDKKKQSAPTKHRRQYAISNANKSEMDSSRTHFLRSLTLSPRKYISQINQQIKRNHQTRVQLWHLIFDFFSNPDSPPPKIIFNDLKQFIRWSKIEVPPSTIDRLYDRYAKQQWNGMFALNMEGFSLVVGDVCEEIIQEVEYESKEDGLLVEVVFQNMVRVKEFREFLDQYYKFHRYERVSTQNSPFNRYDQIKSGLEAKDNQKNQKYNQLLKIQSRKKNSIIGIEEQIKEKEKEVTCRQKSKRRLYDCCTSMGGCIVKTVLYIPTKIKQLFSKKSQQNPLLKTRIKPWDILSLQSIQLMQSKQKQYTNQQTQYHFRYTFNNFFPAIMKALDLYYFASLSLNDTNVGWYQLQTNISPNNGGALYEQYRVLLWVSVGLALVYMGMSIKAVGYISEGRFGLTESGAVAAFPNPMFFFTNIYKLLSLTLTSFIMTTIYDTFDCTWFSPQPYLLARDSSLECLTPLHTGYMVASILSMVIYYPICAYVGPNFQFAEKSLDLKYKPSYLIIFFQCKLVLVVAGVLFTEENQTRSLEIAYISIVVAMLVVLIVAVWRQQPCLIKWFNVVDIMVFAVSLVINVCGLALYLTKEWVACVVGVTVGSVLVVGVLGWYLWWAYFKKSKEPEQAESQELILALQHKQQTLKKLSKIEYDKLDDPQRKQLDNTQVYLQSEYPKRSSIPRKISAAKASLSSLNLIV